MLAELARLNADYESRNGFRFVTFVNRRPKEQVLEELRERIERPREEELRTGDARARRDRARPVAALVTLAIDSYLTGWLDLLIRWLHVIAAIAWIGSSFYFIALDNHLRAPERPADADRGVGGEAGRSTAAASTGSRSSRSRPRRFRSRCTGTSGRPTRRGSRASPSSSSSTTCTPRSTSSTARSATCRRAGDRDLAGAARRRLGRLRRALPDAERQRAAARRDRPRPRRALVLGRRTSCSRRGPPTSRSARCSARSWPRTSSS